MNIITRPMLEMTNYVLLAINEYYNYNDNVNQKNSSQPTYIKLNFDIF